MLQLGGVEDGAVDSTRVGSPRGLGPHSRNTRRSRTPCLPPKPAAPDAALGAQGSYRLEHRGRAAGIDGGVSVASSSAPQVGDKPVMADDPSSVASTRARAAAPAPRGVVLCRESRAGTLVALSPRRLAPARPARWQAGRCRLPHRRAARGDRLWAREAMAERPQQPQPLALPELAQAARAGTDVLEQELGLAVAKRA